MDLIGHRIGNFTLTRVLGMGGMGVVYLAEHAFLERKKAVKVLLSDAAESPTLVRRFFDEAMAASACQHDHIITVEDCGTFTAGGEQHHYIEMEFLDGMHVGEAMAAPLVPSGRFDDCERVVRIAAQAADALSAAHARGIVHRDVKPENLFLSQRGGVPDYVKVLDFGIARLTGDLSPGTRTRTGAVIGTPEYMSPEQARGLHPDGKSDVFSLGVVIYRMLAGHLPFPAQTFSLLAVRITTEPPPPLSGLRSDVPPALLQAVDKAMRKAAADRPSMRELRDLLLEGDAAPRPVAVETSISVSQPVHRPAHPAGPSTGEAQRETTQPLRPPRRRHE